MIYFETIIWYIACQRGEVEGFQELVVRTSKESSMNIILSLSNVLAQAS